MASNLHVETKIMAPQEKGDILISEDNGIEMRYLLLHILFTRFFINIYPALRDSKTPTSRWQKK